MEHPVREIATVIDTLTMGSPQAQEEALNSIFLPNASFTHPFCRVPSFNKGTIPFARGADSRWLILGIYRWYRTLSPQIQLKVDSAALDQRSGRLYVSMHQTFAIWFVPFYKAPVRLVTVLQLVQQSASAKNYADGRGSTALAGQGQERARYFIASQEDLYQANECLQFVLPTLGPFLWFLWQLFSMGICVVGSLVLLPVYHFMNRNTGKKSG